MKAKLLMTSTLLSQVLHPISALAVTEQGFAKPDLRKQLQDYFKTEKEKATSSSVFVTRNYYYDTFIGNDKKSVQHLFALSIMVNKLAVPVTGGSDSGSCNSSSSGGPRTRVEGVNKNFSGGPATYSRSSSTTNEPPACVTPFSYDHQFVFKREDASAAMTAIWGDQKICTSDVVGTDVTGNFIFAEFCKAAPEDLYYGTLLSSTPEKDVYQITSYSAAADISTQPGTAFANLEVWKLANGGSMATLQPYVGLTPLGNVPAGTQFIEQK